LATGPTKSRHDDPEQSRAFMEKAHEIGADEDDEQSDELMKRLAKEPPKPHQKS
jgi:hypothetical protein